MFDPSAPARGYALVWPRELFRCELSAILTTVKRGELLEALMLLFGEALRGPDPLDDLARAPRRYGHADGSTSIVADPAREFGRQLLEHVEVLPVYRPRRYYQDRQAPDSRLQAPSGRVDDLGFQCSWVAMCVDLIERGYLDRIAGNGRVDGRAAAQPWRISALINEQGELTDTWPPNFEVDTGAYAPEHFLTLVEVFHDLVARPRGRKWYDHDGYRLDLFNETAGQAVYRWKVNELFVQYGIDLELVDEPGNEQGQVVRRAMDPRQDLLTTARQHVPDGNEDRVAYAVALFRGRHATPEDKRRACRELAFVLESRKKEVLEHHLVKGDESALFNIANNFAIRHHRDGQMYNYDPDFLDWIFWWYLATVELSNRLIARSSTP